MSDFFHNDDLAFEQRRDSIARRLKASPWYVNADVARLDGVYDVVNDLAHSEDQEEFDRWWDELHDLSDHDRVFIHTR
ncbi:hypothetical protein [Nocardiopsis synnemataformans]|uniref:hypothetical protein n=1 Tax=Nocardiopsis synnemataformans TaxID=61305 RepID=UPI003EB7D163